MALIELHENNAGGLYIVDADGNVIPDLEYSGATFADDASSLADWVEEDRYSGVDVSLMDHIADYDTDARLVIVHRRPGCAGSKYLGLADDSDSESLEDIAAEIGGVVAAEVK